MSQEQRGGACGWVLITRVHKNTCQFTVPVNSSVCLACIVKQLATAGGL
jgi:hypothetical protein